MRNYDFSPLWRSMVGFDRLFELINNAETPDIQDHYPPYDIARYGDENYRISLAVAGFSPEQITITAQQNLLTIAGSHSDHGQRDYLYQGIAARPFERRFSLADHVEVVGATCENGLLQIDLVRRVPDSMKPRRIAIGQGSTAQAAVASRAA